MVLFMSKSKVMIWSALFIITMYYTLNSFKYYMNRSYENVDELNIMQSQCVHAEMQMWSKEYLDNYDKISDSEFKSYDCSGKAWIVQIDPFGKFRYRQPLKVDGSCQGRGISRINEFKVSYSDTFKIIHGEQSNYDFIKATCNLNNSKTEIVHLTGIKKIKEIDSRPIPKDPGTGKNAMNIMFMGFDSVSQMSMLRNMPKTVRYLENDLGAVRLKEYNIVGDGTPAALFPILTGMTELTLPEARKSERDAVKSMDDFPFIWTDLRKKGYVTQWGEDDPNTGCFTYRFVGFNKQPVDHYMRNHFVSSGELYRKCYGNKNTAELMMEWGESIFNLYPNRPIFSFVFHAVYTHNSMTTLSVADSSFHDQLVRMKTDGKLDNTILIILADHGIRYTDFRNTIQGKMEERTPYISIRYPDWFQKKYPAAMQALKENSNILTTPFDIHETLLESLSYTPEKEYRIKPPLKQRMSLISPIDKYRTCESAAVEPHWCGCLNWKHEDVNSKITKKAADHLINFMNNLNNVEVPGMCHILKLKKIISVNSNRPSNALLKFEHSIDKDGRYAKLSDTYRKDVNIKNYMIKLITSPSDGIYEASMTYSFYDKKFMLKKTSISRVNRYGDQPKCIAEKHATLRKYCFCK